MSSAKNIDISFGFVTIWGMFHHTMKHICKSELTNKIKAQSGHQVMYVTQSDTLHLDEQLPNVCNVSSSGTYSMYCAMFGDYKNYVTEVCTLV